MEQYTSKETFNIIQQLLHLTELEMTTAYQLENMEIVQNTMIVQSWLSQKLDALYEQIRMEESIIEQHDCD